MTDSNEKFTWKDVMKYREFLFGLAAVWIVFFHIRLMIDFPQKGIVRGFLSLGNIGVDIFVFLSAVGISYSIEKNSLKDFYKNRFSRLWVPFLIICVPYYLWQYSVTGITLEKLPSFIFDITAINFWIKERVPFWYVSFATVMYLFYPLVYKLYCKNRWYIVMSGAVLVLIEIFLVEGGIYDCAEKALSRIPIFLTGVYMSDLIKENREIKKRHIILSGITLAVMLGCQVLLPKTANVMYDRFIYAVITIPMIILITAAMQKAKGSKIRESVYRFFCFFGVFSLELYLVHNAITYVLRYYNLLYYPAYTYYLWIFPLSVVLAIISGKLAKKIVTPKKVKSI